MTMESAVLAWHVWGHAKLALMGWRIAALLAFQLNIGSFLLLQLEPAYARLPIMIQEVMFANFAHCYASLVGGPLLTVLPAITQSIIVL
jgi:hypothetical protein